MSPIFHYYNYSLITLFILKFHVLTQEQAMYHCIIRLQECTRTRKFDKIVSTQRSASQKDQTVKST